MHPRQIVPAHRLRAQQAAEAPKPVKAKAPKGGKKKALIDRLKEVGS